MTNEALLVNKGEAGTISSLLLKIEDDDNLQDILVMVLDPPKHGRLVRLHGDVAVQQFRPDDLERGQLQYVHDGTDSQQDLVLLQMNDGHSFQNILLQIKVNQKVGSIHCKLHCCTRIWAHIFSLKDKNAQLICQCHSDG